MKKEEKRELTTKQLKRRLKITKWMLNFCMFMSTLGGLIIASALMITYYMMGISTFWGVIIPYIIIEMINGIICYALYNKSEKYKNETIKKMAGKGDIKDKVILESEKYVNTILYYYSADSIINIMKNNKENAIELTREQKRKIANSVIHSIKIEKVENENMNICIKVEKGQCLEAKVPEEELVEIFDLKNK